MHNDVSSFDENLHLLGHVVSTIHSAFLLCLIDFSLKHSDNHYCPLSRLHNKLHFLTSLSFYFQWKHKGMPTWWGHYLVLQAKSSDLLITLPFQAVEVPLVVVVVQVGLKAKTKLTEGIPGNTQVSHIVFIKWNYDPRSYKCNFCNCVEKPEKLRMSTRFELGTSRFRCDAPTKWTMRRLTMAIVKIAFIIEKIIASLDFKSTVQCMTYFIYHLITQFLCWCQSVEGKHLDTDGLTIYAVVWGGT